MSYFRDASLRYAEYAKSQNRPKETQNPFSGIRSNFSFYLYRLQVGQNRSSSHNSSHWWRESERWVPFVLVTQLQSLVGAWRLPQGMRCLCLVWQLGTLCSALRTGLWKPLPVRDGGGKGKRIHCCDSCCFLLTIIHLNDLALSPWTAHLRTFLLLQST